VLNYCEIITTLIGLPGNFKISWVFVRKLDLCSIKNSERSTTTPNLGWFPDQPNRANFVAFQLASA
jgi:hypothetical protein